MSDLVERLKMRRTFTMGHPDQDCMEAAARIEALEAEVAFTLSDQSRRIRKEDVAGICQSPDVCFEYGPVRCEPCAVRASAAKGVAAELERSHLPQVCRLQREAKALEAENARLRRALLACEPFVHHFKGGWSGHTPGDISTSELLATISAALAGKAGT